jgi:hypothetical protein
VKKGRKNTREVSEILISTRKCSYRMTNGGASVEYLSTGVNTHQYLLSGDGSQFNLQQRSMGISLGVTRVANQLPFLTDPKSRRLPLNGAVNSSGVAANYIL